MICFYWLVVTQMFFGMFTPKIGEDEPILTNIFFRWVETTNQTMMRCVTDRGERTPWWYNSIEVAACCWRGCLTGWILGKLGHIDVDWNRFLVGIIIIILYCFSNQISYPTWVVGGSQLSWNFRFKKGCSFSHHHGGGKMFCSNSWK